MKVKEATRQKEGRRGEKAVVFGSADQSRRPRWISNEKVLTGGALQSRGLMSPAGPVETVGVVEVVVDVDEMALLVSRRALLLSILRRTQG